jgi:hypothetical protein
MGMMLHRHRDKPDETPEKKPETEPDETPEKKPARKA